MTTLEVTGSGVPRGLVVAAGWSWRLIVVVTAIVLVARVLYELRIVTVPIFVALLATTLVLPPVRFLQRRGVPTGLATGLVFLAGFMLALGLFYVLASPVVAQFRDLGPQLTQAVDTVNNWLITGPLNLSQADLDQYVRDATGHLEANAGALSAGLVTSATLALELVIGVIVSLILTVFFVTDGAHLTEAVVSRFSVRQRPTVRAAAHRAFHVLGSYVRGVAMTGAVDAVLIGIALVLIGVPLLLPLVILTFFGAFFPVVGATVAGALAALVALVNGGPGDALLVLLAVIVVQQLEGHLLQPLLVGRAVALHPVVIIVGLISGSIVAGILGAFLAVPLLAVVVGVWREVEERQLSHGRIGPPENPPVPAG